MGWKRSYNINLVTNRIKKELKDIIPFLLHPLWDQRGCRSSSCSIYDQTWN